MTDVVIFYGSSNIQLGGELLIIHYPKISVMHGVEQTVYLFLNDVPNVLSVNHMITAHKVI